MGWQALGVDRCHDFFDRGRSHAARVEIGIDPAKPVVERIEVGLGADIGGMPRGERRAVEAQHQNRQLVVDGDVDRAQRFVGERQFAVLKLEQLVILLGDGVLGLLQDRYQRIDIEVVQRGDDRQAADEFGDQAEFEQIFRLALLEQFTN